MIRLLANIDLTKNELASSFFILINGFSPCRVERHQCIQIEPLKVPKMINNEIELDFEKLEAACQLALVNQQTLAEQVGLTSQDLELIYQSGTSKYQMGLPAEAIVDFTYLVMHQPWDRRFHLGLGSCLHWLGEYQHALTFYGYALVMDACSPEASFRIAQCFLSLNDDAAAIEALQMAISQSYSEPEHHFVGDQAQQLLSALNNQ